MPRGASGRIEMGCYGIGISRLVAAAIEQNHDANGIIWPLSIAPFHVLLLPINYKDEKICAAADKSLSETCNNSGVEVLLDDRDERPGSKIQRRRFGRHSVCASPSAPRDWRRALSNCAGAPMATPKKFPLTDAVKKIGGIMAEAMQA